MNKSELIRFIKENTPNLLVHEEAINHIVGQFESLSLEKGEFLLRQGKVSGYYILLEGYLRAYTFDENGQEVTTYFYAGPGAVFEAASFFQQKPSEETIIALSPCRGYFTTFGVLNTLFHQIPEFREFGRAMLVQEFVTYKKRTLAMVNKSAQDRYEALLQSNPDIFQYAQLRHIASYLGITDTSLSRIRRSITHR